MILTKQTNLRTTSPKIHLVSHGYLFMGEKRIYIRVFALPSETMYLIKIKLPVHATLHLIFGVANWQFENNWLMFNIPIQSWYKTTLEITRISKYIKFT